MVQPPSFLKKISKYNPTGIDLTCGALSGLLKENIMKGIPIPDGNGGYRKALPVLNFYMVY